MIIIIIVKSHSKYKILRDALPVTQLTASKD